MGASRGRGGRGRVRRSALALCVVAWSAVAAGAPEGKGEAGSGPAPAPGTGSPGLDQLLELPDSLDYGGQKRGGMTRGEWRSRFQELRVALERERAQLEAAQQELARTAGSSDAWSVGPPIPGAGASADKPLDYRLHQEIARHKSEIERLERELRDLQVRADLVGVPDEWRE